MTETPLSLRDSMQLMQLQSWGDRIRVFPAMLASWEDVAFDGLLAAGAFQISAKRTDGATQFVRIKSLAGEPCILRTDLIPARIEGIDKSAVRRLTDGCFKINLRKDQAVTLVAQGVNRATVEAVEARRENCNTFGLNESNE